MIIEVCILVLGSIVALRMVFKHRERALLLKKNVDHDIRCEQLRTVLFFGGGERTGRCELPDQHIGPHYINNLNGEEQWWS